MLPVRPSCETGHANTVCKHVQSMYKSNMLEACTNQTCLQHAWRVSAGKSCLSADRVLCTMYEQCGRFALSKLFTNLWICLYTGCLQTNPGLPALGVGTASAREPDSRETKPLRMRDTRRLRHRSGVSSGEMSRCTQSGDGKCSVFFEPRWVSATRANAS